jgi:hypothetical protein
MTSHCCSSCAWMQYACTPQTTGGCTASTGGGGLLGENVDWGVAAISPPPPDVATAPEVLPGATPSLEVALRQFTARVRLLPERQTLMWCLGYPLWTSGKVYVLPWPGQQGSCADCAAVVASCRCCCLFYKAAKDIQQQEIQVDRDGIATGFARSCTGIWQWSQPAFAALQNPTRSCLAFCFRRSQFTA